MEMQILPTPQLKPLIIMPRCFPWIAKGASCKRDNIQTNLGPTKERVKLQRIPTQYFYVYILLWV